MVTRVVKLGGSLLELSDWAERLRRWLDAQNRAANLIVVGGGERVETLRREQASARLSDESAHVRALKLMDQNAAEVARALAGAMFVRAWRPDLILPNSLDLVLECGDWAEHESVFERSWQTTSDSVAAEIASQLIADELVLLKSCLPQPGIPTIVDPRFESHTRCGQRIRVVNLRETQAPEIAWRKGLQANEPTRR